MEMVTTGEAAIGLTYISEMTQPGITAVGTVPRELAEPAIYTGVIATHSAQAKAARALLDFLASSDAAAVYRDHRMQPER
jgi:molybdate transport system substrate-binding protein